jgi:hypothetical protein
LIAARREIAQARLQMGYVAQVRSRIARRLAAASWPIVSRLQHARVTNLLGADVQRVAGAANFLMQFLTSLVLTVFQMAIAFLLAPALTGIALVLIAVGVSASLLTGDANNLPHVLQHFPRLIWRLSINCRPVILLVVGGFTALDRSGGPWLGAPVLGLCAADAVRLSKLNKTGTGDVSHGGSNLFVQRSQACSRRVPRIPIPEASVVGSQGH